MLADELDFVLGVDTHRDSHAVGVIEVRTGVVVFEATIAADSGGYAEALRLAQRHAPGPGRIANEAAFARLAGVAPIPASSGQTIRYRLDRSGDRKLNRTLHLIINTRRRTQPRRSPTSTDALQEGKTRREATRCLKRYLARNLYRLLEDGPPTWRLDKHRSIAGAGEGCCSRLHVTLESADRPSTMLKEPHIRRVEVRHLLLPPLWAGAIAVVWFAMPEERNHDLPINERAWELARCRGSRHPAIATYPSLWRSWRVLQKLAVSIFVGSVIGAGPVRTEPRRVDSHLRKLVAALRVIRELNVTLGGWQRPIAGAADGTVMSRHRAQAVEHVNAMLL